MTKDFNALKDNNDQNISHITKLELEVEGFVKVESDYKEKLELSKNESNSLKTQNADLLFQN